MNTKETIQILAILKAAYPNSYKNITPKEASGTISVWAAQFSDIPVNIVLMAVQKHIGRATFPPSVFEIKKNIQEIHWEAYDIVSETECHGFAKDDTYLQAKAIYEITKEYRMNIPDAPKLSQMLGGDKHFLLSEG